MTRLTNPLVVTTYHAPNPSEARYVPMRDRTTTDRGQGMDLAKANNLRWPRPFIIPFRLVLADIDDVSVDPRFDRRSSQESETSYVAVTVDAAEARQFNDVLWPNPGYLVRCYIWWIWQTYLKNLWFFVRYPFLVLSGAGAAAATVYHALFGHGPCPPPP